MSNYAKTHVDPAAPRIELHDQLALTGTEVSVSVIPAGAGVPFAHTHKLNEEVYGVLAGAGRLEIDGETVPVAAGDWLRISPAGKRQFFAADDQPLTLVCIQAKEGSLGGFTADDAVIL